MGKIKNEMSATGLIRAKLPTILKDKFKNGATFNELWQELEQDKELKKVMYNGKKEPRLGLLQGLSNRIKDGREPNLRIITKENKSLFVYYNSDLEYVVGASNDYLNEIEKVKNLNTLKGLTPQDKKVLTEFETCQNTLSKVVKSLQEAESRLQNK